MSVLSIFTSVARGAAGAALNYNPIIATIVGAIAHEIVAQQGKPVPNEIKKQVVTEKALEEAENHKVQLDPRQLDALIEGLLKGIQGAARTPTV